jgi:hypothetical protein
MDEPRMEVSVRKLTAWLKQGLLSLAVVVAVSLAVVPGLAQADPQQMVADALASLSVAGPSCATPTLTQPFASFGDQNYYTPAPGQWVVDPSATNGWLLKDGASIQSHTTLDDGTTGRVLDLPGGSFAIGPPMCVDLTYPTARIMVRNLNGGGGVHAFVSYAGATSWGKPRDGGAVHGKGDAWALSAPIHLQPSHTPGWQLVRFGLVPDGKNSEFQLYNFYVDPYAKG